MFENIYVRSSPLRLSRVVNLEEMIEFSLLETKLFVELSGSDIEIIRGGPHTPMFSHFEDFIRLMSIRLTKVNEIALEGFQLTQYKWFNAPETSFSNLTYVSLRRCQLNDENLVGWEFLTHLETLDLRYNDRLTGSCLMSLPTSLLSLYITGCRNLCPNQLIFLNRIPRLRELRASDLMPGGHWHIYRDLVLACPLLVMVEISICSLNRDEYRLGELRYLQSLVIKAHSTDTIRCKVSDWMLISLLDVPFLRNLMFSDAPSGFVSANALSIISRFRQLRVLKMPNQPYRPNDLLRLRNLTFLETLDLSNSPYITNEVVIELVIGLPNLSVLMVQGCPLLTNRVYLDAELASKKRSNGNMVKVQL